MGIFETICGLTVITILLYYYLTLTFDYWKVRGVKGPRPVPLFGNMKDVLFHKTNMTEYFINIYNSYKDERYVGLFFRSRPILLLRDPQLIKNILMKDFSGFPQRDVNVTEKVKKRIKKNFFNYALQSCKIIRTNRLGRLIQREKTNTVFVIDRYVLIYYYR